MNKPLKPMEEVINGIRCQFVDHGGYYRLQFTDSRSGVRQRKSTGTANPTAAKAFAYNLLRDWVPGVSTTQRVTVADLVKASLQTEASNQRLYDDTLSRWQLRLSDKFGSWDHRDLKTSVMDDYKLWALDVPCDSNSTSLRRSWARITESAATRTVVKDGAEKSYEVRLDALEEASINKDLIVLSKAFNLASKREEISFVPAIPLFGKDQLNTRTGEVSIEKFEAIMAQEMDLGIRGYLQVSWDCGHRAGEPKHLRVHQFDGQGFQIAPGRDKKGGATEKSGQGRWVPLSEAGIAVVKQLVAGKTPSDYVFTRDDRFGRQHKLGDFRKTWQKILAAAAIEDKIIPHDFRRTAVSNLRDAGVDEKTTMEIVGHKTPEMNRRYRQTGKRRLIEAMRQKEAWEKQQAEANAGTPSEADQVAALRRQVEEAEQQKAQMQAALAALQTAISNLTLGQATPAAPALKRKEAIQ